MGIQLPGAAASPAHAEKARFPLQVHLPVGSLAIVRREHLDEVIANRFIPDLGKATRASFVVHRRRLSAR